MWITFIYSLSQQKVTQYHIIAFHIIQIEMMHTQHFHNLLILVAVDSVLLLRICTGAK